MGSETSFYGLEPETAHTGTQVLAHSWACLLLLCSFSGDLGNYVGTWSTVEHKNNSGGEKGKDYGIL